MKNPKRMLVVLVMLVGLMVAVQPVAGQPPHALTVSGHSCVYMDEEADEKITGQNMHVKGHVLYSEYDSFDETVLRDGTETSIVNINLNFKTSTLKFHRTMIIFPDGAEGTFEGVSSGYARFEFDPTTGDFMKAPNVSAVLQGTGEFKGLTMKLTLGPGDASLCREDVWDTALWSGFIVPPGE